MEMPANYTVILSFTNRNKRKRKWPTRYNIDQKTFKSSLLIRLEWDGRTVR